MEVAVDAAQAGQTDSYQAIAENARGYAALLRDHIAKEDEILYPLAERVLPETKRPEILQGYQDAEAQVASDFGVHYEAIVTMYEQE